MMDSTNDKKKLLQKEYQRRADKNRNDGTVKFRDLELKNDLKELAQNNNMTVSELCRSALKNLVDTEAIFIRKNEVISIDSLDFETKKNLHHLSNDIRNIKNYMYATSNNINQIAKKLNSIDTNKLYNALFDVDMTIIYPPNDMFNYMYESLNEIAMLKKDLREETKGMLELEKSTFKLYFMLIDQFDRMMGDA